MSTWWRSAHYECFLVYILFSLNFVIIILFVNSPLPNGEILVLMITIKYIHVTTLAWNVAPFVSWFAVMFRT